MKRTSIVFIFLTSSLLSQNPRPEPRNFSVTTGAFSAMAGPAPKPIEGAPYSATATTEFVQTLADGNRIVQKNTSLMARDSQGRTRNELALPMIGNMSAEKAPHIVIINDPVAEVSYNLNLEDKTAHKMPMPFGAVAFGGTVGKAAAGAVQMREPPKMALQAGVASFSFEREGSSSTKREDLGSQTMEGVQVQGMRTTRTIPAGEIGNQNPIEIVEEIWTSPELKVVVYSKRTDPRSGEQTLRLTNIVRSEPDPALFTVPSDFKLLDMGDPGSVVVYRPKE